MAALNESTEAPPQGSVLSPSTTAVRGAYFALVVLFSMNMLNYVDRYVFYVVGELVSRELSFNDFQFGILSSSFMVVYTLVAPLMGHLGDRANRTRLLAFGVGLWSLATVGTAFAGQCFGRNFEEMFFWRALLGVGEATYGVVAPTLLADLFSPRARGRVIGLFYLALPVGGAIGYGVGGWVGYHWGWRFAFLVAGLPGLIAAGSALWVRDPGRGASEGKPASQSRDDSGFSSFRRWINTTFVLNTLGLTAVTFATGAYAVWGATFYQRVHGMEVHEAGKWIGSLTLLAGLVGIGLGMWVPDLLRKISPRAYMSWAGLCCSLSVPFALFGLLAPDENTSLALIFGAMVLLASVLGPCNTVTANVVPARHRAAGFAISIFVLHALGDILSPPLIGRLSIWFGDPTRGDLAVNHYLAQIGHGAIVSAEGVSTNLTVGMLSVVPMLMLGGVLFLIGSRYLQRDQERARLASMGAELPELVGH
jgi:MFS family permease